MAPKTTSSFGLPSRARTSFADMPGRISFLVPEDAAFAEPGDDEDVVSAVPWLEDSGGNGAGCGPLAERVGDDATLPRRRPSRRPDS